MVVKAIPKTEIDEEMNQEVCQEGESVESALLCLCRKIGTKVGHGAKGSILSTTPEGAKSAQNMAST
jgi:hypothetical protein